ncbi:MAG: ComEA family DNA-binding protein [Firmicutes bacterium]|nr:ComEA family DNA-binding protein [Bacillota bacterium]
MMIQMTRREQVGAMVLAGLLILGLLVRYLWLPKPTAVELTPPQGPAQDEPIIKDIIVHVAGAVSQPGVYTLPEGARVFAALEAAGGVLPDADEHALNLAEPLFDGRRITVPYLGENEDIGGSTGKLNINAASVTDFDQLPGIGPTKAAAIVAYRDKNGPFKTLDDLANVTGIGINTVETLRDYITLY